MEIFTGFAPIFFLLRHQNTWMMLKINQMAFFTCEGVGKGKFSSCNRKSTWHWIRNLKNTIFISFPFSFHPLSVIQYLFTSIGGLPKYFLLCVISPYFVTSFALHFLIQWIFLAKLFFIFKAIFGDFGEEFLNILLLL